MHGYLGHCQCGAVKLTLLSALKPSEFQPRSDAANCILCQQHDGVWVSDADGELVLNEHNATRTERFASEQVEFHFCVKCGELTYAIYFDLAVVRLMLFSEIAGFAKPVANKIFDRESIAAGRERRMANWTPIQVSH